METMQQQIDSNKKQMVNKNIIANRMFGCFISVE